MRLKGRGIQADSVTEAKPRQLQGIEHISEGAGSRRDRTVPFKKKKSRHEVKAIMSPFVESLSAGEHSTTPTPF